MNQAGSEAAGGRRRGGADRWACRVGGLAWVTVLELAVALGVAAAPVMAETVNPSPYWRNTINFPEDAFRAAGPATGDPGWIKFTIFTSDPTQVYFQHSTQFDFHYDFAHSLVQEYTGMSWAEYDAVTLHAAGQQAILGAVILPYWYASQPAAEVDREYGIQFVRQDAYDPAQVVTLFNLVKLKISAAGGAQAFYFPAYEQAVSAEENRAYFEAQGVLVSSPDRWATGNVIYAPGWALGTLKFFPADQIAPAYENGNLLPGDILLTDGVPAEVPIVAGIVSLLASTPNSHVAILANTYGMPFVHLALADDQARAQQLVGQRIALRAYTTNGTAAVALIDAEALDLQQVAEIVALKTPPPLNIAPVTAYGAYSASTQALYPTDIRYFGGKAANFGLIRRSIPNNSPVAAAFSFDLWTAFMGQVMPGGQTLAEVIQARLGGYAYPPVSMAALAADLAAVRDLIKDDAVFAPELQAAVLATLADPQYGFDPNRNIRFRSSTNVEDSAQFTGAGLYDSFSGCLADDLDGDSSGPSICDPTEARERGVFRAIRKVYASFYNDNAFLERRRHQVPESQVGMGILVHHSTPDPEELANGVATYNRLSTYNRKMTLVTQDGAVPVTNPPIAAIPEVVDVALYTWTEPILTLNNYSNLLPLGSTVLTWDSEYRSLINLLLPVSDAFAVATGKSAYILDFEYKKVAPSGALRVKQVREIPRASTVADTTPFLLDEPVEYCTFQGEYGNVFANHRLKTRWLVRTRNTWLTTGELATSIYADSVFEYVHDGEVRSLAGAPAGWPGASYGYANRICTEGWHFDGLDNPRAYVLTTRNVGVPVSDAQSPLLTIRDLGGGTLELRAAYAKPEPILVQGSSQTSTTTDSVRLQPCPPVLSADPLIERSIANGKGVVITTRFYWQRPPSGVAIIWTAPLARWEQTTITGYTAQPIVLRGFWSQTYRPEHHNFGENFLFEPELEPDLPAVQRAELRAQNIRMIYVSTASGGQPTIATYPFVAPGDFDRNGRVDGVDVDHIAACATGPLVMQAEAGCQDADLDGDRDVDLADFGMFQRCYSGTGAARANCLDP